MIPKYRMWNEIISRLHSVDGLYFDREVAQYKDEVGVSRLIKFQNAILMQSTGLYDKNGKEIFEGDILKFNDEWADYGYEGYIEGSIEGINYVEIKREKTCFTFGKTKLPESSLIDLVENEHYPFEGLLIEASYEFEIIGNVYENPELLEVTE